MSWLVLLAVPIIAGVVIMNRGQSKKKPPPPPPEIGVVAWEIGPVVGRTNYSVNMPLHPAVHPEGWSFDFGPDSEPHYITTTTGSLLGKAKLVLRYRIEAAPGTVIYPKDMSGLPSQLALYFQRAGDNWSGAGDFEDYRWYSRIRHVPIAIGEHELVVNFSDLWGAIQTSSSVSNPTGFRDARANAARMGFVMGGGLTGVGHGVRATGPTRMVVTMMEAQ